MLTLGGWLAGALQWHFAAMWLLVINGIAYVTYGVVSGHFRRKFFPLTPAAVFHDVLGALRGKLAHEDLSVYNAAQRAAYLAIILCAIVLVFSGLAIWKPVQLQEITAIFGGYESARVVHFLAMAFAGSDRGSARRDGDSRAAHFPDDVSRAAQGGRHEETHDGNEPRRAFAEAHPLDRAAAVPQARPLLGALALLSGCGLTDDEGVQRLLMGMSRWNDRAQGWLFNPNKLAPEFPESAITRPFPFNAYYSEDEVTLVDGKDYKLRASMASSAKRNLDAVRALRPAADFPDYAPYLRRGLERDRQVSGVRFSDFLARVGADTTAKYVGFECADDYSTSIDMATALHPQTLLTLRFADQILPPKYGFPMKLRMPTKLGFKNPKHIMSMFVTNEYPGGYWEDQGYNWFSGS